MDFAEQAPEIIRRRQAGEPWRSIGATLGVSRETVRKAVIDMPGVAKRLPRERHSAEFVSIARQLWNQVDEHGQKMTGREIAAKLAHLRPGFTKGALAIVAFRNPGFDPRPSPIKRRTPP